MRWFSMPIVLGLLSMADASEDHMYLSWGGYYKSMDVTVEDAKLGTKIEGTAATWPSFYLMAYTPEMSVFQRWEVDVASWSRTAEGDGREGEKEGGYFLQEDGFLLFLPRVQLGMLWMPSWFGLGAGVELGQSALSYRDKDGKANSVDHVAQDLGLVFTTPMFIGRFMDLQALVAPSFTYGWSFYNDQPSFGAGSFAKLELVTSVSSRWLGGYWTVGITGHDLPGAGNNSGGLQTNSTSTKIGIAVPLAFMPFIDRPFGR